MTSALRQISDDTTQETPQPTIVVTFADHLSAEVNIQITDCSPFQLWGAARMIEQYAEDQWNANMMKQAMDQAKASVDAPAQLQDHKRKKGN